MSANVNIVINAHDRASGVLRGIAGLFGDIFRVALGFQLSAVFSKLGQGVRSFAVASIEATAQIQNMNIGIETLIAREIRFTNQQLDMNGALLLAAPRAREMMDELAKLAILSPYQLENVNNTFRQAMAFGFAAEEAKAFTAGLMDVAAGTGAASERLDRMAYNLAQVRLQGKVTKLDIRQLALAGFDLVSALKYIGAEHGVVIETHLDFNEAIKNGTLLWKDFALDFEKYARNQFGGASERMARTLFGLKNTFHDVFALSMPSILGPTVEAVTGMLNTLLDQFIMLREDGTFEAWGDQLLTTFYVKVYPVLKSLIEVLTTDKPLSDLFKEWLGPPIDGFLKRVLGEDYESEFDRLLDVLDRVQGWLDTKGAAFGEAFETLIAILFPEGLPTSGGIFTFLIDTFDTFTGWLETTNPAEGLQGFVDLLTPRLEELDQIFRNFLLFWEDNGEDIKTAFGELITAILPEGVEFGGIDEFITSLHELSIWFLLFGPEMAPKISDLAEKIDELQLKFKPFGDYMVEHGATIATNIAALGIALVVSEGILAFGAAAAAAYNPVVLLAVAITGLNIAVQTMGPAAWQSIQDLYGIFFYGLLSIYLHVVWWADAVIDKIKWAFLVIKAKMVFGFIHLWGRAVFWWDFIKEVWFTALEEIIQFVIDIIADIKLEWEEGLTSSTLWQVGYDLIKGFADGVAARIASFIVWLLIKIAKIRGYLATLAGLDVPDYSGDYSFGGGLGSNNSYTQLAPAGNTYNFYSTINNGMDLNEFQALLRRTLDG